MLAVLTLILKILALPSFCTVLIVVGKLIAIGFICRHPELSDEKVKWMTKMMSREKKTSN